MIQPNELRIGNICKDDEGLFARIAAIENKTKCEEVFCVFELWIDGGWVGYWELEFEEMQPIPLTHRILVQYCGFDDRKATQINDYEKEKIHLLHNVIDGTSNFILALITSNYGSEPYREWVARIDNDAIWTKELKYLHQLQNLYYAINQAELEINF